MIQSYSSYSLLYTRSNHFEDLRFKQFNPFTDDNSCVIQRAIKIAEKRIRKRNYVHETIVKNFDDRI